MVTAPGVRESLFLRACRRESVERTPVWFMRQAGRYMAEYRALRQNYTLLQLCRTPDLATEVTLQPVRRIDVDAAILFSDLLIPLEPMGIPFDFIKGEGPAIERPIRSAADIDAVKVVDPRDALGYTFAAIRQIKGELGGDERAGLLGRLHHHGHAAERRHDAISRGEAPAKRCLPWRHLGDHCPALAHLREEPSVTARIGHIRPTT